MEISSRDDRKKLEARLSSSTASSSYNTKSTFHISVTVPHQETALRISSLKPQHLLILDITFWTDYTDQILHVDFLALTENTWRWKTVQTRFHCKIKSFGDCSFLPKQQNLIEATVHISWTSANMKSFSNCILPCKLFENLRSNQHTIYAPSKIISIS